MIVSRQNPKLKTIRRLRQCKGDTALLEGPHLIEAALDLGLAFEIVLATPEFLDGAGGRGLGERLQPRPLEVEPTLLRELSDVDAPQGILAAVDLPRDGVDRLPRTTGGLYVFAEGLQDPGNLGALARSLEAAGGDGLALSPGSVHPNHPRALRGSAGSLLRLAVARDATVDALRDRLAELDPTWVALTPGSGRWLYELDLTRATVLVVGAEGHGLEPATVAACDERAAIPMAGRVESLNVAVAAAICLFEARRQRVAGALPDDL